MKSALILTGNIRTFENCINSFINIIDNFDPDIFICVSNYQYQLHPYIREQNNFYNECLLNEQIIMDKFSIIPNLRKKIKKIIISNEEDDDNYLINNLLKNFDQKKGWLGEDIFKQYMKLKKILEFVEKRNR